MKMPILPDAWPEIKRQKTAHPEFDPPRPDSKYGLEVLTDFSRFGLHIESI